MMNFNPIYIGQDQYQLQELIFKNAIRVAMIPKEANEKRMTTFLNLVLDQDTLYMTLPKRYYCFLHYLKEQVAEMLKLNIDVDQYLIERTYADHISMNGITVRHITGYEAEYIEENCKSILESLGCLLAMKLSIDGHEQLNEILDPQDPEYLSKFIQRLEYIKKLPGGEFEYLYSLYSTLDNDLTSLVDIVITNNGFSLRGADDVPMRFCPSTAFTNTWRQLDDIYHRATV